mgnify:CR=1 FL=1
MKRSTYFLAAAFILLWNSGFIGAEYGLKYAKPFTMLFWRYMVLTVMLFLYLLVRRRFQWPGWLGAAHHMAIGALAHGVWLGCVHLALQYGVPAGIVALIVALQPITTGAFSGMVTGEDPCIRRWVGLIIGFAGVAITVIARIDFSDAGSVFGYLIPLGSVAAITAASLMQRRMELKQYPKKIPLDLDLFYQSLATTVLMLLPAIFMEKFYVEWEVEFIYIMLWVIFAVSLGAYTLMWILIERMDTTRVASLFYFGPPVTMLMAWVAFNDKLLFTDVAGLVVVMTGVWINYRSAAKSDK